MAWPPKLSTDNTSPTGTHYYDNLYADDGCEESPTCLTCPLEMCRYDDPVWYQRIRRQARDKEVYDLVQKLIKRKTIRPLMDAIEQAAVILNLTVRTVHRRRANHIALQVVHTPHPPTQPPDAIPH